MYQAHVCPGMMIANMLHTPQQAMLFSLWRPMHCKLHSSPSVAECDAPAPEAQQV